MFNHNGRLDCYDDKLVLRNPGTLRLPIEKIYEGGTSRARNPRIQNMLRMIGYGENLGSGFPKIVAAWKEAGWGEPVLESRIDLDEVELVLPLKKSDEELKKNATFVATSQKTQQKTSQEASQKTSQKIVALIEENPYVTTEEMAHSIGIDRSNIWRNIKKLQENGIVRRVGPDKGGHWEVIEDRTE